MHSGLQWTMSISGEEGQNGNDYPSGMRMKTSCNDMRTVIMIRKATGERISRRSAAVSTADFAEKDSVLHSDEDHYQPGCCHRQRRTGTGGTSVIIYLLESSDYEVSQSRCLI